MPGPVRSAPQPLPHRDQRAAGELPLPALRHPKPKPKPKPVVTPASPSSANVATSSAARHAHAGHPRRARDPGPELRRERWRRRWWRRRRRRHHQPLAPCCEQGTIVAGYRVDGVLGEGGMGTVYRATQLSLNRVVALKLLARRAQRRPRVPRPLRARGPAPGRRSTTSTSSPSTRRATTEQGLFLAMRLIDGPTLKDLILGGKLEARRALRILAQVAQALDEAHAAGLIHRDIKPQNILIGRGDHAYLADFGLIKARTTPAPDRHRPVPRHDRLRRSGADPGRAGHRRQRLLLADRGPVRVPDRRGAVPASERGRDAARPDDRRRRRAPTRASTGPARRDRRRDRRRHGEGSRGPARLGAGSCGPPPTARAGRRDRSRPRRPGRSAAAAQHTHDHRRVPRDVITGGVPRRAHPRRRPPRPRRVPGRTRPRQRHAGADAAPTPATTPAPRPPASVPATPPSRRAGAARRRPVGARAGARCAAAIAAGFLIGHSGKNGHAGRRSPTLASAAISSCAIRRAWQLSSRRRRRSRDHLQQPDRPHRAGPGVRHARRRVR